MKQFVRLEHEPYAGMVTKLSNEIRVGLMKVSANDRSLNRVPTQNQLLVDVETLRCPSDCEGKMIM